MSNSPTNTIDTNDAVVFELTLLNKMSDLERMSPWLEQCAETIGLSMRGTFRLQLLVEEVVMNIVENAHMDQAEHSVVIGLFAKASGLVIRIEDDGAPFDPTSYPEATLPEQLVDAEIGGLGLHLVRAYADGYRYQRAEDKNILTLQLKDSDNEVF
jgi:anti-sigma regulatory factor (Ser/Thr protein kinase)